eukprot:4343462-Pleurochrysis_carterae.AAC.6
MRREEAHVAVAVAHTSFKRVASQRCKRLVEQWVTIVPLFSMALAHICIKCLSCKATHLLSIPCAYALISRSMRGPPAQHAPKS